MNAPLPESAAGSDELARLAGQIASLEEISRSWDAHHADTLAATKTAIEELNREAFRRLLRFLREDPACAARLSAAVHDPFIFGVLRFHGLVRDPLEHRVERALEEVRPFLREHGGDVELVAVHPPHSVDVRLLGACHGCPASAQTWTEGIERSIRSHCPEVEHVRQVSQPQRSPAAVDAPAAIRAVPIIPIGSSSIVSPFSRPAGSDWQRLCMVDDIADGGILALTHAGHELLLYRRGERVSCMRNACAHLGMPLDAGELRDGVLKCSYHGFTYKLETGECLTVPEVRLTVYPIKVTDNRVDVRLVE